VRDGRCDTVPSVCVAILVVIPKRAHDITVGELNKMPVVEVIGRSGYGTPGLEGISAIGRASDGKDMGSAIESSYNLYKGR
jgi:hypothetical protein